MATSERDAAIVGIYEYPQRDVKAELSGLQIKAECAALALEDAGLSWSDVDAVYDAGHGGGGGRAGLSIRGGLNITPHVMEHTRGGGVRYEFTARQDRARHARGRGNNRGNTGAHSIASVAHPSRSDSTSEAPKNEYVAARTREPVATAKLKVTKPIPAIAAPRWAMVIGPNG